MSNDAEAFLPRRLRAKPPPIDLSVVTGNGSTPNRIQFWSAAQQRVAPELGLSGPGSPTPLQEDGLSPGIALSPLFGEGPEGGWAGLPAHVLELIFAALRDSQGRWPSRKVIFQNECDELINIITYNSMTWRGPRLRCVVLCLLCLVAILLAISLCGGFSALG